MRWFAGSYSQKLVKINMKRAGSKASSRIRIRGFKHIHWVSVSCECSVGFSTSALVHRLKPKDGDGFYLDEYITELELD